MRKPIKKKPAPVTEEAVVVETPVEVVAEPVAEPVVEQAPEPTFKLTKAKEVKPATPAAPPAGPAPNTSEHGSGGVYRSTGDGRRIALRRT